MIMHAVIALLAIGLFFSAFAVVGLALYVIIHLFKDSFK